jgi:hypothetical protein
MDTEDKPRSAMTGAARKVVIAGVGGTVTAAGIAMLVLPGPGILTIVAGLAILSQEFDGARRWLDKLRATVRGRLDAAHSGEAASVGEDATGPPEE